MTRDGDGEADESGPERVRVAESGAVGDSVHLEGTYVGGRDVHVHLESDLERADLYMYQLPPDIGDFTGRGADLARLRRLLGRKRRDTPVVISAIAGKAGVGKTALATKAAHQLRSRFPDGQLYVNLRGAETQRLDPADVLGEFLLALGVARSAIPDDLNGRASRYRARLANRSVLVLITSRVKLTGLEGAAELAAMVGEIRRLAPTMTQVNVSQSGATAAGGGDVRMSGEKVAGRDMTINEGRF